MKIVFKEELRADHILGMLAIIPFRIFCLLFWTLKKVRIKIYKPMILPLLLYGLETWNSNSDNHNHYNYFGINCHFVFTEIT
jgi:hypothetical protein